MFLVRLIARCSVTAPVKEIGVLLHVPFLSRKTRFYLAK
jgi:hypothetical protein